MGECRTLSLKECDDMKKILLALILVLVMAGTAAADTSVPIMVNGISLTAPGLMINNSVYVPLRAVSQTMGAKVDWTGSAVIVNYAGVPPSITGDLSHKAVVENALQLLQEKDSPGYRLVCAATKEIKISSEALSPDGGGAYAMTSSNGSFILDPKLIVKSPEHIAATLVHESSHLCGNCSERIAYIYEIATLQALNASQSDINEVMAAQKLFGK